MTDYPNPTKPHRIEHDRWMIHPDDKDYLPPAERYCRVCGELDSNHDRTDNISDSDYLAHIERITES